MLGSGEAFLQRIPSYKIEQVGRDQNSHMNALASLASVFERKYGRIIAMNFISVLSYETLQKSVLCNTKLGLSWMDPIIEFMRHDKLLEDKREAHKLRVDATRFWISLKLV